RHRHVLAAEDRVAGVGRTGVVVVAVEGRSGGTGARLARLRAVTDGRVGASGTAWGRRRRAAGGRGAAVGGARVAVVAVQGGAGVERAALVGLRAVAGVHVAARRAVRHRHVLAAEDRVAAVGRTGVVVVAVEGRAGGTRAALAGLRAVTEVRIGARGAVGDVGHRTAGRRVAAVGGAGVAVVADERRARRTGPCLARLVAVAEVAVRARRAVCPPDVRAPERRGSAAPRASSAVVAVEGRAGGTRPALAGLQAVAEVAVRTRRAVRDRRRRAAGRRDAAVGRARVAVVADERRAGGAGAVGSGSRPVAGGLCRGGCAAAQ